MPQPWKLRVLALCLATTLSGVSAQEFTTSTGTETSTNLGLPAVPPTEVPLPETTSLEAALEQAPSSATDAQVEISTTAALEDQTTEINLIPSLSEETTQLLEPSTDVVPPAGTTETSQVEQLPETATTNINVPLDTTTGPVPVIDTTTQPMEPGTETTGPAPIDETTTELPGVPEPTSDATPNQPPVVSTDSIEVLEPTTQAVQPTTEISVPEGTTETTQAIQPTTEKPPPEVTTESAPVAPTTNVEIPEVSTSEESQIVVEPTTEDKPDPTTEKEAPKPTTEAPGPKPTTDESSNEPTSKNEPGQTSAPDEPQKTTAPPKPTATEDGIVTGDGGAVVTYVPEQDKDFSDFTGTTTTTDDGGAAIIIFPGGWFWKPSGNLPAGILPPPPAGPPPAGGAGGAPGGGDGNNENEDEDDSTKDEEEKSTAEPSETVETTAKSTEATTTTEACSAVEIEDCTRTISYFTTDGTATYTEFGDCPTVASCATGTQATSTETVSAEVEEGEDLEFEELDGDIPDDFDKDVDQETIDSVEESLDQALEEELGAATTTEDSTATSTDAETKTETKTEETTSSEATTERTTTVPSTLLTTTRNRETSEESTGTTTDGTTSDMITSTTATTTMRTYYPCVPHGGPRVATPFCSCETTTDGEHLVATAPMISGQCDSYTEFPMSLYTTPPPAPAPTIFNEPYTETDAGTVRVYQSYSLSTFAVYTIKATATVGLGDASTVSTPVPTATNSNGDGSDICSSSDKNVRNALAGACVAALGKFEDDTVYTNYVSRYERMGSILKVLSMGQAGCTVQFSCNDYGIGMKGSDIKDLTAFVPHSPQLRGIKLNHFTPLLSLHRNFTEARPLIRVMSIPADPLAGLDSVNWPQLTHAYGPADDVSVLLRELQSTDPEIYLTALDECWSSIYHQGTRYSASVETVPFLYSLLDHQDTKNRPSLLYMITALAIGHPNWCVPNGLHLAEWEKRIADMEDKGDHKFAVDEFKCYEAVESGLSCIIRCLEEESSAMRATAAHALAFFPRFLETSVPALTDLISRESCRAVRGTAVLALAILFAPLEDSLRKSNITQQIQDYHDACCGTGVEKIYPWSCALALLILGVTREELLEKAKRVLTDKTFLSEMEANIGPDDIFPFGMLDLRHLAQAVLGKAQRISSSS
ncbi:hypothetical protein ACHAPA_008303 [Fusarium lateritium]